ncbi:MAG: matrixin family metalloprotease, partial [Nanoarchaeota archaeon]|nr:matrixin family metalloprotease [Nanoarchaeota archaeon]
TSKELFNNIYTVDSTAQYGVQNFKNAIAFGNYQQAGVIAVTSIWYTRVGKQIVEFDMLFDTDYTWGNADPNNDGISDNSLMDLQNIATHELGHGVGLNDIYSTSCNTVTMYGYSNYGDIAKRSLEAPDVTGLRSMYGA